ncbi:MAG: toxin-antitoxin system HicB family antitoxin [Gammaproteobacteria bacterium]
MSDLHVRIPEALKREIAAQAKREGVSMSVLVSRRLKSRIDWPTPDEAAEEFSAASAETLEGEGWDA